MTPNSGTQSTISTGPTNINIFQASLHDIILYMYGGTNLRTCDITIYMELTNKDVYTAGNYYVPGTTTTTSLLTTPPDETINSIKFILLNRFYNKDGFTSLSCIIPAGRKFIIRVEWVAGDKSDITFTAMKFGR